MAGSSLQNNPPTGAGRHITSGGSDWLWAVFAIMLVSDLGMILWTFMRPRGTRLFHQIAIIVLTVATICYFGMASDLGWTAIQEEFSRGVPAARQIWYVRYIQWFINLPLLLIELLLATGLTLSDIFTTVFMAWVLVICGLVGALVPSTYKWGFFVLGIVLGLGYIWWALLGHGPRSTFAAGGVVRSGYLRSSGYLAFLLLLYPIAWGCSEGGNVISPTGEMIWYGILDILAGPVFLLFFLWGLRSVEFGAFGLNSGKYTDTGYGNAGAGYGGGGVGAPGMAARNGAAPATGATAPAAVGGAPAIGGANVV